LDDPARRSPWRCFGVGGQAGPVPMAGFSTPGIEHGNPRRQCLGGIHPRPLAEPQREQSISNNRASSLGLERCGGLWDRGILRGTHNVLCLWNGLVGVVATQSLGYGPALFIGKHRCQFSGPWLGPWPGVCPQKPWVKLVYFFESQRFYLYSQRGSPGLSDSGSPSFDSSPLR